MHAKSLGRWLRIAEEFIPRILNHIPQVPKSVIPTIEHAMATAESTLHGGGNKKEFVMSEVRDALAIIKTKRPELNADGIESAVSQGIDTAVATVQLIASLPDATPAVPAAPIGT